jgi:ATP-dependent helicase/nuclease subunit A
LSIPDQAARSAILDIQNSFIVQAPAGSGKTGLLVQRMLALLAQSQEPESILAITFTRKAAEEMRQRVGDALNLPHIEHMQAFQVETHRLARKVSQKHPQLDLDQLQIMTFDALCQKISYFKASEHSLHPFPEILYRTAARSFLNHSNPEIKGSLRVLSLYLDGRHDRMVSFFMSLLDKRDQWLPWLMQPNKTEETQSYALNAVLAQHTQAVMQRLDAHALNTLIEALNYTHTVRTQQGISAPAEALITPSAQQIQLLKFIATIVLTRSGDWRVRIDNRQGFPSPSSQSSPTLKNIAQQQKTNMIQWIKRFKEDLVIKENLNMLSILPSSENLLKDTRMIGALTACLPQLAAHFKMTLNHKKCHDFLETSLSAINQLENTEEASPEIIQQVESIHHILVDEAQDTSLTQFRLLSALINTWSNDQTKTLFIVGDPMQSIYRFRQAQVSLFEKMRQSGINNHKLKPIYLSSNFRSNAHIVDYTNKTCSELFPKHLDFELGAIPHHPSESTQSATTPVQSHWLLEGNFNQQADWVARHISAQQRTHTQPYRCAILLRSRTHIDKLVKALKNADIAFQAEAMRPLAQTQHILDLIALTQAIADQDNALQWHALLHAPWYGFSLQELAQLSQNQTQTILKSLKHHSDLKNDFGTRCKHAHDLLFHAITQLNTYPLDQVVRQVWFKLQGPSTLKNISDIGDVETYFQELAKLLEHVGWSAIADLNTTMSKMYGQSFSIQAAETHTCEIMTIHKAKGLEFDHVYLPFLDQAPAAQSEQLLWWHSMIDEAQQPYCLLAPCAPIKGKNPLTHYLKTLDKQKDYYESQRLFYVATTRARQSLHLVAAVNAKGQPDNQSTLLAKIWPTLTLTERQTISEGENQTLQTPPEALPIMTQRLKTRFPIEHSASKWQPVQIEHAPQNTLQTHFGQMMHHALYLLSLSSGQHNFSNIETHCQYWLQDQAIMPSEQPLLLERLHLSLNTLKTDPRLHWILSSHLEAQSEYCFYHDSKRWRIDRTFIEHNVRWIIDYKTTPQPTNLNIQQWKNALKHQHQIQLETYAKFFIEHQPKQAIQFGIYGTENLSWVTWPAQIFQHSTERD